MRKIKQQLMNQNTMRGGCSKWTMTHVSQTIGRFICKTSLDELPQFLECTIGDMIIGTHLQPLMSMKSIRQNRNVVSVLSPGLLVYGRLVDEVKSKNFDEVVKLDVATLMTGQSGKILKYC